jgi:phosphate transport system substrate-binding protein
MRSVRLFALLLALCLLTSCVGQPPSSAGSSSETPGASSEILPGETPAPPVDPTPGTSSEIPDNPGAQEPLPELPPEPVEQFVFTRDNFPRLNGSTSTVPLGKAIAAVLLGEAQDAVEDLTQFSKTTASYRQLMHGFADLLIAAEPAAVIWEEKAACGFEWEMAPFAVDGLVFVVNEGNPVDSLTIEQVQKIYTGEITNWKEVGGADEEIFAYQRNQGSGSQSMLERFMDGTPLMEPPTEQVQDLMSGIIERVSDYRSKAGSIGFSFRFYVEGIIKNPDIKMVSVDGIAPTADNIRNGSYPIVTPIYAVTYEEQENDNVDKLLDWILSEEGQYIIEETGYVGIGEAQS